MVYQADGNFIKTGMVFAGGRRFEAFKETNNSPAGARRLGRAGGCREHVPGAAPRSGRHGRAGAVLT